LSSWEFFGFCPLEVRNLTSNEKKVKMLFLKKMLAHSQQAARYARFAFSFSCLPS